MARGKSINIYLPEGNPKGIEICEIPNSISKAILIPRNMLDDVTEFEDINCAGIYFLFSDKDEYSKFSTYIGEAENLFKRIKQHDAKKENWNYVVCFLSEKGNLNKAHIKFLESYCYSEAIRIRRTSLENSTSPQRSNLTKQEEDFALHFFDELKIILGILGYPVFEKIKKAQKNEDIFYCRKKDAYAKGNLTEKGFVVYEGSLANLETRPSSSHTVVKKRNEMIDRGFLGENDGNTYYFTQDFEFNSPSIAAAVVVGGNANGWNEWKNEKGKTLDEVKRKKD